MGVGSKVASINSSLLAVAAWGSPRVCLRAAASPDRTFLWMPPVPFSHISQDRVGGAAERTPCAGTALAVALFQMMSFSKREPEIAKDPHHISREASIYGLRPRFTTLTAIRLPAPDSTLGRHREADGGGRLPLRGPARGESLTGGNRETDRPTITLGRRCLAARGMATGP